MYMEKAIVVISFDGYKDLWDTFFECFEKFFPDCTLPVYLITNNEMPTYPHATVVTTGDEVSWSHRLRRALEEIPEDTLLVLLEDYFLCEKTSSTKINELFQCFAENDYDYLRVIPIPIQYRWKKNGAYPLDPLALYGVNLQAAIWKKAYLQKLLYEDDFSAWEFEARQKTKSNMRIDGNCATLNYVGLNYLNGVIQGKWYPRTVKELKKHGIIVPTEKRPVIKRHKLIVMDVKNWLAHHVPAKIICALKPIAVRAGYKFVTKD